MKILFLWLLNFFLIFQISSKLLFVVEVFRHGSRSPAAKLHKGKDLLGTQWIGSGQLTKKGMLQHFLAGQRLRSIYVKKLKFLSKTYNPSEILIFSSDTKRTIMSAYSKLQGLYPPSKGPALRSNQTENAIPPGGDSSIPDDMDNSAIKGSVQVIPVHEILDKTVFRIESACQNIFMLQNKKNLKSKKYLLLMKQAMETIAPAYGWNKKFFESNSLLDISDVLLCNYFEKKSKKPVNKEIFELAYKIWKFYILESTFSDPDLILMYTSSLMNKILNFFAEAIKNKETSKLNALKYVMYSCHDSNLSALLNLLKFSFNTKLYDPVYTSSLFFEIHEKNLDYFIKITMNSKMIYYNDINSFVSVLDPILLKQDYILRMCSLDSLKEMRTYSGNIVVITVTFIVIVILSYAIYNQNENKKEYDVLDKNSV